ncbi:DUF427 domain-containing protein [Sinomonas humi]|uniref:DUF427 domain-containing protein n=1 Tax=Sinomonas humi TaxID=1338436 RepID=UPI00069233AE|nr:DUF427 domain-containing protein [Sinomonas humi]
MAPAAHGPGAHPTVTAWYGDTCLARSEQTVYLEGNHYFPPDSIRPGTLAGSWLRTLCPWKGIARYHHAEVDGISVRNAAWSYPRPSPLARRIKGMVAFEQGTGITIREGHR